MPESLKSKTIKGVGWSAADTYLGSGISFIVGLVLARILSPSEYGLLGICLIFTTILDSIVDSGFSKSLIRKKDANNSDYNTMFITNMVVSIALYIILFICSPFIANFFERPELKLLIRVIGIILIINALSIVQITILTKRIDFKTKTKASLISGIISGIIGILMALTGFGVWSLVAQQISRQSIYSISLWILNNWLPRLEFKKRSFNYMWGFGWKLMASNLLDSIWGQLYQVVVGKCYSPSTLGQYTRSNQYASIFSQSITSIVQRVTYPVLSELQDDEVRMMSAYRKVIKMTMFVTCIFMIPMGAVAEPLIYCLIGPQWHEAATFLPLICVSMSLYPLHAINLNMLQVLGRSDIFLEIEIMKKIIAILPICLGIFVNIYWMLFASIFTGLIAFFLNSYYTGKKLGYTSWMQLKDVAPDYGVAIAIALSIHFFKYLSLSYWIVLPLQVLIGIIVGFIICNIIKLPEYYEVKAIAKKVFKRQ